MTVVNNKKEYIEALKNGETEFYVKSQKLLIALQIISKFKSRSDIVACTAIGSAQQRGIVMTTGALVGIVAIITAAVLALSMYAMHKDYDVYIEYDRNRKRGRVIIKKRR